MKKQFTVRYGQFANEILDELGLCVATTSASAVSNANGDSYHISDEEAKKYAELIAKLLTKTKW